MFKVKYVDSIMMLVRLDLNLIVSLFQHKYEVSETVSTTTLVQTSIWVVSGAWVSPIGQFRVKGHNLRSTDFDSLCRKPERR